MRDQGELLAKIVEKEPKLLGVLTPKRRVTPVKWCVDHSVHTTWAGGEPPVH